MGAAMKGLEGNKTDGSGAGNVFDEVQTSEQARRSAEES
jgi:hypothetical protein